MKSKRIFLIALLTAGCVLSLPVAGHGDEQFDKYGGWTGLKGTKTGVFHTEAINNRWWIITPAGNVFWSTGVYSVRMSGIPDTETKRRAYQEASIKKHGSEQEWARVTRKRLKEWGFNTVGDWSSETIFRQGGYVYVVGVDLPRKAPNVIKEGAYGYFPDVFDPVFQQSVYADMEERFKRQAYLIDDPWLLGYFLADEPSWYGSKQRHGALTDDFIALPADSSGKQAWVQFLKTKHEDIGALNAAWGTSYTDFKELLNVGKIEDGEGMVEDKKAFLKAIALQFSRVLFSTLRQFDPHHMVVGTRPTRMYPEILEAIGEHTDIFGVSHYDLNEGYEIDSEYEDKISKLYSFGKRPILLGVLIAAKDTDLPYGIVKTQRDRGISYWRYLAKVASDPRVVGMHWFQYFDPPKKCYDAMAANWGLVNQQDEPYEEAVSLIAQANHMVYAYALGVADFTPRFDTFLGLVKEETPEVPKGELSYLNIPIANADFENQSRGWKLQAWKGQSKASIDSKIKHAGKYALLIEGGPDEGWESVGVAVRYHPGFLLKAGLKYKLSAWIKTDKVENFSQVRIKTTRADGTNANYEVGGIYGTKDWSQYENTFSVTENVSADYLAVQLVGTGKAWFDDIQIQVLTTKDSDAEQFLLKEEKEVPLDVRMLRTKPLALSNGDFEQGDKDWGLQQWKGKPKVGVAWFRGRDSLRALEIKGVADGWDSVGVGVRNLAAIKIDPAKRYIVKAWVKTKDVTDKALLKIKVKYEGEEAGYFESEPVSGSLDWAEIHTIVQLKSPGAIEYLACQLVGRGTAWFDDVSVAEILE